MINLSPSCVIIRPAISGTRLFMIGRVFPPPHARLLVPQKTGMIMQRPIGDPTDNGHGSSSQRTGVVIPSSQSLRRMP
jgi:hypothetical protein